MDQENSQKQNHKTRKVVMIGVGIIMAVFVIIAIAQGIRGPKDPAERRADIIEDMIKHSKRASVSESEKAMIDDELIQTTENRGFTDSEATTSFEEFFNEQ